ncbi:MAG: DUF1573 domain-containing protein [Planctomycetia bacterium]|nr:DUF1573 domain-containing protein [Planctomycetia bacterium]
MYRTTRLGLFLFLATLIVTPVWGQQWAVDMFQTTSHDFGGVARGAKAEFEFPLTNIYMEDVHIVGVRSSCGCTQVRLAKPVLKTYETGAIVATINTSAFQGDKGATITVTIDKPYYAEVQLHSKVYIRSDVVLTPGSVSVGDLNEGQAADARVAISHIGGNDWRILEVRSENKHVSGEVVETGRGGGRVSYDLSVHIDPNAPVGYLNEHLMLVTSDGTTQVPVPVEGRILSGITVSPASLFMGVVEPGQKVQKQLVVRGNKPFRILSIKCDGATFEFDTAADQEAKTLHLIPVTFVAGEKSGRITGRIQIETDLGTSTPELPAYAVVTTER